MTNIHSVKSIHSFKYLQLQRFMNHEDSIVRIKRQNFRKSIRNKHIEQLYLHKRMELLEQQSNQSLNQQSDNTHFQKLITLIQNFDLSSLKYPFEVLLGLDLSGQLFEQITSWSLYEPHPLTHFALEDTNFRQRCQFQEEIARQHWKERIFSENEMEKIKQVWNYFGTWDFTYNTKLEEILQIVKSIRDINKLINHIVIRFYSFVANFISTGDVIRQILIHQQESVIVDAYFDKKVNALRKQKEKKFMQWQLYLCIKTLHNILAGDDSLILPILNGFLEMNGKNIRFIELYFNMFLVKGKGSDTHLRMLNSFIDLLSFERQYFLQDYFHSVYVMYLGFRSEQKMELKGEYYISIGQKVIRLLDSLMKVINIKYDAQGHYQDVSTFTNKNEDSFPIYLTTCISVLSETPELLREILKSKNITRFFLNSISYSKDLTCIKSLHNIFSIMSKVADDNYCCYFLFQTEPQLVGRMLRLMHKYKSVIMDKKCKKQDFSNDFTRLLNCYFYTVSSLCIIDKFCEQFLELKCFDSMMEIYPILQVSKWEKEIKFECSFISINLVMYLHKNYTNSDYAETILELIFSKQVFLYVIAEILTATTTFKPILNDTINALLFVTMIRYELKESQSNQRLLGLLNYFLNDHLLKERIMSLLQSEGDERICDKLNLLLQRLVQR